MKDNNFKEIESKWQKWWEEHPELYSADDSDEKKEKCYVLVEFPYPSGAGLHAGHARSWTAMDIYTRKRRMQGYNVLFPMGWDAFGLPAENYALKMGVHPSKTVPENIARFRQQCKSLGLWFDWSREIDTTDPKYYKWTQWIFLQLYKKGLVEKVETQVNWCPFCKTTLSNEEVNSDGTHERCGKLTEKKTQKQWVIKITKYADRLIDDLKLVDYSPNIALQQINWIGKSDGARIRFKIQNPPLTPPLKKEGKKSPFIQGEMSEGQRGFDLEVFTTRPDTLYGATFMVVAPEHSIVSEIIKTPFNSPLKRGTSKAPFSQGEMSEGQRGFDLEDIQNYVVNARKKSDMERAELNKEKTGVFSGLYAINPVTKKEIPIWISDFVLASYGTGAIMSVPAHDDRDKAFAEKYNLPIVKVIDDEGKLINSDDWNGISKEEAFKKVVEMGIGELTSSYHLRDWIFSRQHYWGEPIPMVNCPKCGWVPVKEEDLPIVLPYVERYEPSGTGESPLANIKEWVETVCPKCGGEAKRETDTMPNWAGSNWYFMRYLDPDNDKEIASKTLLKKWLPVDLYQGGFEHTTLHLLYSRFIYKFLFDIGVAFSPEPYKKRRSHGIVLGADGSKMSKSSGNVVNPDDVIAEYGADSLRIYEMFIGPFDQVVAWNSMGASGCNRFLLRFKNLFETKINSGNESDNVLTIKLNKAIIGVGNDIENLKFNTAVSTMMELINSWKQSKLGFTRDEAMSFLKILAPFAPFLAEELWSQVKCDSDAISVHVSDWPKANEKYLVEETVTIPVAINGKVRDQIIITNDELRITNEVVKKAKELEKVKKWLEGKEIVKEIYVAGKMVNLVVK